jgi:virginiamycin B lyase
VQDASALLATALCHPAAALALPDGDGRETVEAVCAACHGVNLIERSSGYTRDDWQFLASTMIDLSGDPAMEAEILDYLAENFPPGDNRAATPVDGPLTIRFEEWKVPTLGQRSRDPVEAPDGSIWWVGQWLDILGRIDPETGDGGIRPARGRAAPFGEHRPRRRRLVHRQPQRHHGPVRPGNRRDHRISHARRCRARSAHGRVRCDGILWFSLQGSNMIGRLDPETGEVRLVTSPRERSRPYGVKIAADGTVWVACNGANCLLRIDPETME